MNGSREPNCGTCRFWARNSPRAKWGRCKRRAPGLDAENHQAAWPATERRDWCGEHERKARG